VELKLSQSLKTAGSHEVGWDSGRKWLRKACVAITVSSLVPFNRGKKVASISGAS
jgi:hypothetical protein